MIAESSKQLALDFSALEPVPAVKLAELQQEYESFRQAHFEFHTDVSRDVRSLIKENNELKNQLEAAPNICTTGQSQDVCTHAQIIPGLDRAHCPDCKRDFKPRTSEYKFSLECAVVSRIPGDSAAIVQGDTFTRRPPGQFPGIASKSNPSTTASGWIEKYVTRGRWEYHRYCWQEGRKGTPHRMHIPNDSGKLSVVRDAVAQRRTPQEIEQLIKSWAGSRVKAGEAADPP